MHDDHGEAAIQRERAAAAAAEDATARRRARAALKAGRQTPVIEGTDAANAAFREKLAYWRERGAPAYHGPRAGRDT